MMIEFQAFCDESHRVFVDPARVVAMTENLNQLSGRFLTQTLVIELETGSKIEVYDTDRRGVARLREAFYPAAANECLTQRREDATTQGI